MTKEHPGQPAWWIRAKRPRPHTFAVSKQELLDFDAVVGGGGFKDRSKAARAMIRRFDDRTIKQALQDDPRRRLARGKRNDNTTVSVTLGIDDVEALDRWVEVCRFENRSALFRAMVRYMRQMQSAKKVS